MNPRPPITLLTSSINILLEFIQTKLFKLVEHKTKYLLHKKYAVKYDMKTKMINTLRMLSLTH